MLTASTADLTRLKPRQAKLIDVDITYAECVRCATMRATVVDLFCGIGGLSYGFKAEGFEVAAGIDSDESCKYAYETNVGAAFLAGDIRKLTGTHVNRLFDRSKNSYRVLIGCAPCAPFSFYTGRYRKSKRRDPKWQLLKEFARLIRAARPDIVSMENVPRLTRHRVFAHFVRVLKDLGYRVTFQKVKADHFGVPQRRSRLVLIASLHGQVSLPAPTHKTNPVTVRDAIGNLPRLVAGGRDKRDRLHTCRALGDKNLRRLQSTTEGGSWKDWDEDLQLACHKKRRGKSFRSVYGRMRWDSPAPVVTTQCLGIGNGRFGHPEQDRAISIREAALLQSFPKSFKLVAPREEINGARLARQIGNAVPVKLSRVIARAIRTHLVAIAEASKGAVRRGRQRRRQRRLDS